TYSVPFFFFQAEDGIRDGHVTGVQTCALPILSSTEMPVSLLINNMLRLSFSGGRSSCKSRIEMATSKSGQRSGSSLRPRSAISRSEERRVGKECRSRWGPDDEKRTKRTEGE